ncbi:MAG: hypothetical protein LBP63_04435 [Prevotellaceae bacterium]|jgi:hypothetical protein|nr:hypothetical protein [Prevotellaceae bacterium]
MKKIKKLLVFTLFAITVFHCMAQAGKTGITPREVLAKCQQACSTFNYDDIKECISQRNLVYVDLIKKKLENPDRKFQKDLIATTIQTAKYDILEENISVGGKTARLKAKVSVLEQTFTADIAFVVENGRWKIDDIPNAHDIPNQIPILQMFIK